MKYNYVGRTMIILFLMRSLYTEDIEGTKPKLSIYDKSYFKQKHLDQIRRDPRNTRINNQYQWLLPNPKQPQQNLPQHPPQTIKLISEHTGLARSMHYESLKKNNNDSQPDRHKNHSVLSRSGVTLLKNSRTSVDEGDNPYFPHRIRQAYDQSVSTKFTGNRNWNTNPSTATHLPNPRSQYTSKWNRI